MLRKLLLVLVLLLASPLPITSNGAKYRKPVGVEPSSAQQVTFFLIFI